MGNCRSCESTSIATVKLVLHDGQLQEFSHPVKASHILQKNPTCFICNSDDMEFDGYVSAIGSDEELELRHLYFVLPKSWLTHPLQAEEMASLAVKASLALTRSGGVSCGCCRKQMQPVEFLGKRDRVKVSRVAVAGGGSGGGGGGLVEKRRGRSGSGGGGGGRGRTFVTKLSAVPED